MFANSKTLLNKLQKGNTLFTLKKQNVASKRLNTYFDINVDWFTKFALGQRMTISKFLVGINLGLFLYVNSSYIFWKNRNTVRFERLRGVSYSAESMKNREYIPLVASLIGSYRVDDLILETGVLLTIGKQLEKMHGTPFMFKMMFFAGYIGFLSTLFWVRSNSAKRERYHVHDPRERNTGTPNMMEYRFMSSHGMCMSLVYFTMYKTPHLRKLIPLVLAADYYIWGPLYLSGAVTGVAVGLIL